MQASENAQATADEADVFEALIASERVEEWIETIRRPPHAARRSVALRQLGSWVTKRGAYAEEARKAGAVNVLTQLLGRLDDAEQTAAAQIIAACSGPAASPAQTRAYHYGKGVAVAVCEGCLAGDGLGARVWLAAQALARTLLAAPPLVAGRTVLEVGSGVGLIGLLASQLSASHVTLSDIEAPLLLQLRRSVRATLALRGTRQPNTRNGNPHSAADSCRPGPEAVARPHADAAAADASTDWDQEDADSCDDLDDFLAAAARPASEAPSGVGGPHAQPPGSAASQHPPLQHGGDWDWEGMAVRYLDWSDALPAATDAPGVSSSGDARGAHRGSSASGPQPKHEAALDIPPRLPFDAQFQVVLGSDVLYEAYQAAALAATLQQKIAPGGFALLCCPVREQAVLDSFVQKAASHQLALRTAEVVPLECDVGIADQARSYEGGFRLMAVKHEAELAAESDGWGGLPWDLMLGWQQREC